MEEEQKRSGIGGKVSERPEGAEIVGIRRKRGEKGDIITGLQDHVVHSPALVC